MDNIYLVMERAHGGELLSHIPLTCGIREVKVHRLFREMVCVVQYCNQKGMVHLDLKPENFVVDSRVRHPKLIDFGLSTSFMPGQKLDGFRGTLPYCAPEIIQGKEFEGIPADVWSLGVTLYFMLTGKKPFRELTNKGLEHQILRARYNISPCLRERRSLIQQILMEDPTERPTLEQVMGQPWLSQGKDSSPSPPSPLSQPLPKRPNPNIMTLMLDMGYNPYKAWFSLENRQFDGAMATYLLLQHKRIQGPASVLWAKAVHNGMAGHHQVPGADPSSICPNKCPSEPALALPCEQPPPDKATPSAQKGTACASMPVCPLHLLHVKTPPSKPVSQRDPLASQGGSTGQPGERSRGWRGVTRRMATCLQLCFWGSTFRNRVVPRGVGHRPHRFHNRVAPMVDGQRPQTP
ncbi:sperm motility kinase X-like [Marmota monax]|uniref:sperm motility kinase X-like n=1 Tax=Marmota monax TaxID=9995 RepID=UPI001EB0098B|nr:sperm motility kinase X-like [Marmota monax]